jgi:hypothetical protein
MRIVCRNCFHMWKAATLTPCPNCECSDLTVSDVSSPTTNSRPNCDIMAVRIAELEAQNAALKVDYLKLWNFALSLKYTNLPAMTENQKARVLTVTCQWATKILTELDAKGDTE